jgi:hypothetical protein
LDPIGAFIRTLVGFMTLAAPRTLTHLVKNSLATLNYEIRATYIFDIRTIYILISLFSIITMSLMLTSSSQQFSTNYNTIYNKKKDFFVNNNSYKYNSFSYIIYFLGISIYIIYLLGIELSINYINIQYISFS